MFIYMFSQRQPQFEETHVAKGARERILCLREIYTAVPAYKHLFKWNGWGKSSWTGAGRDGWGGLCRFVFFRLHFNAALKKVWGKKKTRSKMSFSRVFLH